MTIGENIKARRTQLKMSQEYVADQLGISRQAVAKWEAGKSEPSPANLSELSALLELSMEELTDPRGYAEVRWENEREAEESARQEQEKERERKRNAKFLLGRWMGYITINAAAVGYSGVLTVEGDTVPYAYWMVIMAVGLVLLLITSIDMAKRHKLTGLQVLFGGLLLFSIFYLKRLLGFLPYGFNLVIGDISIIICLCVLNLKYWRHIWDCRRRGQSAEA